MDFYRFHPRKMRLVGVELYNRSSTVFLVCLLDDHPRMVNMFYTNPYDLCRKGMSAEDLARTVYKGLHEMKLLENLPDYHFPYSYERFRVPFLAYLNEFGITNKHVFIAAHYAYAVLANKDVRKIDSIVYHAHGNLRDALRARKDFLPRYRLILTLRDPRASAYSLLKEKESAWTFETVVLHHYLYDKIFTRLANRSETLFVRHEDLHLDYRATRKRLCAFLAIPDSPRLSIATILGKPLRTKITAGSTLTPDQLRRPNPVFVKDDWKSGLTRRQLDVLQWWMRSYMRRFHYALHRGSNTTPLPVYYEALIASSLAYVRLACLSPHAQRLYRRLGSIPLIGGLFRFSVRAFNFARNLVNLLRTAAYGLLA